MNLLPFGSVAMCPACHLDVKGFSVTFSTHHVVPAGDGRFVSVQRMTDPDWPHLEKHCPHCGYGWLEEPAMAQPLNPTRDREA